MAVPNNLHAWEDMLGGEAFDLRTVRLSIIGRFRVWMRKAISNIVRRRARIAQVLGKRKAL